MKIAISVIGTLLNVFCVMALFPLSAYLISVAPDWLLLKHEFLGRVYTDTSMIGMPLGLLGVVMLLINAVLVLSYHIKI